MNDAIRLLEAMNGIAGETVLKTQSFLENQRARSRYRKRRAVRTLLLAAVIASLLGVTAYAVAQFTMKGRAAGEGERFAWAYDDVTGSWKASYVFTFEGPAECREIVFKAGWAPSEDYWWWPEPDEDGWSTLLEARELYDEEHHVYLPACVIDICYGAQCTDGGALILMDFTPQEIVEEDWEGGVKAYKFQAVAGHAIDREQTVFPTGNFVILFHPEQGWVVGVRGYDSMENLEGIARGLEIRQLDTVVRQEDFVRNVEFGDIYIG